MEFALKNRFNKKEEENKTVVIQLTTKVILI